MRWRVLARELWRISHVVFERTDEAAVRTYAASIAYRAIVAAVSLASVVLLMGEASGFELRELGILPPDLQAAAEAQAARVEQLSGSTVAIVGLVGVGFTAWGLASGFAALYDALNRIHGTHRYRTFVMRYGRALLVALAFSLLMFVAFSVLVAGSSIGREVFEVIGLERVGRLVAALLVLAAMLVLAPVAFTLLLRYGSIARPAWTECATAGTVTGIGWVVMTLCLLAIVEFVGAYRAYGALAIALTLMLYVYWTSYLLFTSVLFARSLADEFRRRGGARLRSRASEAGRT